MFRNIFFFIICCETICFDAFALANTECFLKYGLFVVLLSFGNEKNIVNVDCTRDKTSSRNGG